MEKKRAGYYGGFGFNTLQKDFLLQLGDTDFDMRKVYLDSLKKVRDEQVDIFIGNHVSNVDLLNKRKYMLDHPAENPFVDKKAWKSYLDCKRDELTVWMREQDKE